MVGRCSQVLQLQRTYEISNNVHELLHQLCPFDRSTAGDHPKLSKLSAISAEDSDVSSPESRTSASGKWLLQQQKQLQGESLVALWIRGAAGTTAAAQVKVGEDRTDGWRLVPFPGLASHPQRQEHAAAGSEAMSPPLNNCTMPPDFHRDQ